MSFRRVLAAGVAAGLMLAAAGASAGPLAGFTAENAARQQALEAQFDKALSGEEMKGWLETLSSEPNHVGSPHDKANADLMLAKFKSWGWDARIETFEILYPTPVAEKLELLGPHPFTAALHETPVDGDRTSGRTATALPPYVAYQGDGDVTADIVYVNYGMPEDYKALERLGVSVKGKIVLARYGAGWRGLKPQLAEEHGAVGCLIFSDPADDGYATDDVWPKGGQRPPQGVQRGSVQKMMIYAGDPLTPGVGATKDARRLTRETATTILKIPALPISYADAQPFLEAMGGPLAPRSFRGALPITYRVGGAGAASAHLLVKSDWSLKPIYDVIAVMKGKEFPDQWVVRGNHHDGWVFGATDPLSGNVVLMEEAKAIGTLAKSGWRPKRTLVYASWDAEEPGLIGSTEWAEAHGAELQKKAVAYVNSDSNERGFLNAEGSHSLQTLVNQVAADVTDPETGVSVAERRRARAQVNGARPGAADAVKAEAEIAAKGGELPLAPLGSGSDYSAFIQHLGVASIDLGYGGEGEMGGVYHSIYDSYDHYLRYGDPDFRYEVALAQTAGRIMLRLADADTPPLRLEPVSAAITRYLKEVKQLVEKAKADDLQFATLTATKAFALADDPTRPTHPPTAETAVGPLDFTAMDTASQRLARATTAFDSAYAASVGHLSKTQQAALEPVMSGLEQALTAPEGLPGRPWFHHMIYAPGMLTGYGAKTLPGIREAIESRRWAEAQAYIGVVARTLDGYSSRLEQTTAALPAK
jgi:N-acetylated-alpha-linked acidic dipeptidase